MIRGHTRLSRRRFLKVAGVGLAAAGLGACVAPPPQTPAPAPAPGATVAPALAGTTTAPAAPTVIAGGAKEIRVLVVGDPFQFALQEVVNDFTTETGIKVNLESLAYDALNARLVTSFVSKTPDADVVTVDAMWMGQYYDNGWVSPLDSYIKADKSVNIMDFIPEVLYSINTWRGHVITLPIAPYGQGVIYRTDVLQEAGVPAPPTDPSKLAGWTWDKYIENIKGMNGKTLAGTKMFGTVIVGAQPVPIVHMYSQLAASRGVRWFKQFPTPTPWDFTPTINTPDNVSSLDMYKTLYSLSPQEAINYVWFDAGTRFSQGDVAMFYWWTPYFYLVKNDGYMSGKPSKIQDKYSVGMLPKLSDNAQQVISGGGWSLGLPSTAGNPDAGWQFIKWACSAATQKKMALVPKWNYQFSDFGRLSMYQDADVKKIYPYLDTQLQILKQGNGKAVRPPCPIYSTLEGIYGLQLNKVLSGAATSADALKETDTLFKNALSGNLMIPYSQPSYDDTLENTIKLMQSLA
jgi:multiple sugar transport system substrate-binding protein